MDLFSKIYIYSDQPATCPKCGSRTEIISDMAHIRYSIQIHQCCIRGCEYEFVLEENS